MTEKSHTDTPAQQARHGTINFQEIERIGGIAGGHNPDIAHALRILETNGLIDYAAQPPAAPVDKSYVCSDCELRVVQVADLPHSSAANVELLIENLAQTTVDYERAERSDAKYYRQELEKAKQAIRDALTGAVPQTSGVWQSIETAPQDGRRILATGGGLGEDVEVVTYNERIGCWSAETCTLDDTDHESQGYNRPTHWQPMPSTSALSRPHGGIEDCNCVGAVIGQHDRSCRLSSQEQS